MQKYGESFADKYGNATPGFGGQCAPFCSRGGATQSTRVGTEYHKMRADQRRAEGVWDMVNEPFRNAEGEIVKVPVRVDLKTGQPVPEKGVQEANPDAVMFKKDLIVDDTPIDRPLSKDRQEIIRFIKGYEKATGRPPKQTAIERYDPATKEPVMNKQRDIAERTVRTPDGRTLVYNCYLDEAGNAWVRHGRFRETLSTGVIVSEGEYKNGKENGIWCDRYPSGVLASRGLYVDGLEQGWWQFWDEAGHEEQAIYYRDGVESEP